MSDIRRDRFGSDTEVLSARLAASSRAAPKSPSEMLQPEMVPAPPPRSRAVRHPLVVFLNFILTIVIVAVVAGGAGLFIGRMQFDKPGALDQSRSINIDRGTSLGTIADVLQREGAISSKWLFVAGVYTARYVRRHGAAPAHRHVGLALSAGILGIAASYATFDAWGFAMAAGTTFVLLGLTGAAWNLTRADLDASRSATGTMADVAR